MIVIERKMGLRNCIELGLKSVSGFYYFDVRYMTPPLGEENFTLNRGDFHSLFCKIHQMLFSYLTRHERKTAS